jgi:SET domain-containing protein
MAKSKPTLSSLSSAGQKPNRNEKNDFYEVRKSGVHGYGGFAKKDLKKGTRVTEYLGDRITHKEADKRYEDHDEDDNHTFLFIVDKRTVIDAGVAGNNARFINHQCDPNCESTIEKGRVWIEAIRPIKAGDELGYDYQIGREPDDPENVDIIYACRCGSPKCRGTMLWPAKRPAAKKKKAKKKTSAGQGKGKAGKKRSAKKK